MRVVDAERQLMLACLHLPDGWQQYWSEEHEALYIFDSSSGQSTWLAPVFEEPEEKSVRKKPLLVVLPVDDKRSCGLSSDDAEEVRFDGLVGSLAAEYVVPDLFPELGSDLWEDDWHFTLEGQKAFA